MSAYHESHGASLKQLRERKEKEGLDHVRIHAKDGASADHPGWVVLHFTSENDGDPKVYEFDDGDAMLSHIAEHAHVPMTDKGEEE